MNLQTDSMILVLQIVPTNVSPHSAYQRWSPLCFPLFLLTLAHTHRHQLISFETPPPHIGNLPGNSHFRVGGWNHTSIGLWQLFSEYKPLLIFVFCICTYLLLRVLHLHLRAVQE